MPPKPQTHDGLKNKGNRLSGFARGNSDNEANYNAPAPKQASVPPRSDTPNATAHPDKVAPTREELAKAAKIDVFLKPSRKVPGSQAMLNFSSKPSKPSPIKARPNPVPEPEPVDEPLTERLNMPLDEDATNRALFEGSQLGDDFMNSRVTTPHPELEDVFVHQEEERQVVPPRTRPKDQRISYQSVQEEPRGLSPELGQGFGHFQRAQGLGNAPLQLEGSRIVLNQSREHRRDKSHVRDGFTDKPLHERRHSGERYAPASPAKLTRDLPYRGVKIKPQKRENRHSKQRGFDPPPYNNYPQQVSDSYPTRAHEVIELEEEDQPIDDPMQETTPKPSKQPQRIRKQPQGALMESAMASAKPPGMNWNSYNPSKKRSRAALDYDDNVLAQKSFGDLLNEPFDLDPAQAGNNEGGDGNPLSNKLERFAHESEDGQREFFSRMKIDDWEESGDWFVDRFADLMKRVKEARRAKRKVVSEFEKEEARREEAVRMRSDALDRKMQKMRQDGLRVVGERQV